MLLRSLLPKWIAIFGNFFFWTLELLKEPMQENVFDFDLLVIGSGPAGHHAAIEAAKSGKRVAVAD